MSVARTKRLFEGARSLPLGALLGLTYAGTSLVAGVMLVFVRRMGLFVKSVALSLYDPLLRQGKVLWSGGSHIPLMGDLLIPSGTLFIFFFSAFGAGALAEEKASS